TSMTRCSIGTNQRSASRLETVGSSSGVTRTSSGRSSGPLGRGESLEMNNAMPVLPDVLAPGLAVVFCGTAAGSESALRRAYYAGPNNAFWPALFEVGLTPRQFAPEEYLQVLRHGLGLTDLAKGVSGSDRMLDKADFSRDELESRVQRYAPGILAFTSKKSAQVFLEQRRVRYGLLETKIGTT